VIDDSATRCSHSAKMPLLDPSHRDLTGATQRHERAYRRGRSERHPVALRPFAWWRALKPRRIWQHDDILHLLDDFAAALR